MDAIDARIVRALQRDGRLTNLELAEEVGLSPSPCLRRVRNLEAAGVIQGYTALVDQKACGYPITCLVRIRLANHSQENRGECAARPPHTSRDLAPTSGVRTAA